MARRPSGTGRSSRSSARGTSGSSAPVEPSQPARERIVSAFLGLLAEKSFESIGLAEVAAQAGVTLAELRAEFSSTLGIYAAHVRNIDREVLSAGSENEMDEESPRERLFDVLMRRLDAMGPYRAAVRSLLRSVRRNPPLAFALNGMAVRSQQWMMATANIDGSGPRGTLRAQGLVVLFGQVLRTWVDDDDPGLARTMAALDRQLGRGQRFVGLLDDLCRFVPPRCPSLRRWRRHRHDERDEQGTRPNEEPSAA